MLVAFATLSGCGSSLPPMTEEENELISEYAASLLLKYDSENHSRLVDTSDFYTTYNQAVEAREESIKKYEEEVSAKLDINDSDSKQPINESQPDDSSSISSDNNSEVYEGVPAAEQKSLAEFLNADGFSMTYAGYLITNRYPENSKLGATALMGKKLLVVKYDVYSPDGGMLDVFNENASFSISVNDGLYFDNNPSSIEDDMSQYQADFTAGETKQLVLLFEISDSVTVEKLSLGVESIFSGNVSYNLE